jgi:hypothetical protein
MSGGIGGEATGASVVLTTKGDIVGYDTARKRIGVGANDEVLTADSTNANGLAWKSAGGGSEFHEFTTAETFNPTKQTGLTNVTIAVPTTLAGQLVLTKDGTDIETFTTARTYNDIIKPSTSLAITSEASSFSYADKTKVTNDANPKDVRWKPDGSKFWELGTQTRTFYQWDMTTNFDVSTASYNSAGSFSVSTQTSNPFGFYIKSDGTKVFVYGGSSSGELYQYDISTPWDISTASYISTLGSYQWGEGFEMKPDGSKLYVLGSWTTDSIYPYTLSTPWTLSTATYDGASFNYSTGGSTSKATSCVFNQTGTKLYVGGTDTDAIHVYTCTTAYDLTTCSYDSVSYSVSSEQGYPMGFSLGDNDGKMILIGEYGRKVNQYNFPQSYSGTVFAGIS